MKKVMSVMLLGLAFAANAAEVPCEKKDAQHPEALEQAKLRMKDKDAKDKAAEQNHSH